VLPAPLRSAEMDARLPKLPELPSDLPRNVAVISNTGLFTAAKGKPPELAHVANAVPFLGYLISFSYSGHRVWIFEGHPSALAAGLEHAEVLLLDSGMLPFLQQDWMAVAQRVMDPPRRVLIYTRERPAIQRAVPASTPQAWAFGEPDGEASYINCLLTTLAKSGPGSAAEIMTAAPLPDLSKLTQDADELEWIANLPFRYDQLDAGKAIEVLTKNRGASPDEWVIKSVLIAEGEQRKCEFSLHLNVDQARKALSIPVI